MQNGMELLEVSLSWHGLLQCLRPHRHLLLRPPLLQRLRHPTVAHCYGCKAGVRLLLLPLRGRWLTLLPLLLPLGR